MGFTLRIHDPDRSTRDGTINDHWTKEPHHFVGPLSPDSPTDGDPMPPIETIVAYVWAAFMTLVTVVLSYYGFVVAERQELAIEPTYAGSTETAPTDSATAR